MAAAIVVINQTAGSCGSLGGIAFSQGVLCEHITDVTFDVAGIITGFTMATPGQWAKVTYDDNETAQYQQEGDRNGKSIRYNQTATMQFAEITAAKILAAVQAAEACCTVWIHESVTGVRQVQGIDIDLDASTWKFSITNARVTPSANTNTSAQGNEDLISYSITSVGRRLSATTSLDEAAIAAL